MNDETLHGWGRRPTLASLLASGLLTLIVLLAACSDPAVVELASGVTFIEEHKLDVVGPADISAALPGVVLLHGAGLDRDAYRDLAESIAARDAVVFIADWRVLPSSRDGGLEDAACAVRYARNRAKDFGVDPERIILVGHSTAGVFAGRIGTDGDSFSGECTEAGSALPNALVIVSPAQVPGGPPWPHPSIGDNLDIPIAVIHGLDDEVVSARLSDRTVAVLREVGYNVTLLKIPGGHYQVVMVDPPNGPAAELNADREYAEPVIDEILAIAEQLSR